MNSTVLALILLSGLHALSDRPIPSPEDTAMTRASTPFQAAEHVVMPNAKGRPPLERLQLRMDQRLAMVAK